MEVRLWNDGIGNQEGPSIRHGHSNTAGSRRDCGLRGAAGTAWVGSRNGSEHCYQQLQELGAGAINPVTVVTAMCR